MGSAPTFDPSIFTHPISQSEYHAAHLEADRRTPGGPRDPGPLPDGLDLQADHGDSRAPGPPDPAEHDLQRHRVAQDRREPDPSQRRQRDLRAAQHERCPQGLLGHLLLQPRSEGQGVQGPRDDPGLGAQLRPGGEDRDRPAGRGRRADPDARLAQPALRREAHRPAVERRRQRQPRRRPGRPRDQSTADGGRLCGAR